MKKMMSFGLVVCAVAGLTACASSSPDVIRREDAQIMSFIQEGVVISIRPVTVDGSQSGIGAAAGGVIGAIGGSGASGVQREQQALGVLGAVAGAVVGNAIERMTTREEAVEILVQLKNGDRRAIVQAKASEILVAGDAVTIVTSGSKVRVTKSK
jgi:outer membrane lipoprotein SlyB